MRGRPRILIVSLTAEERDMLAGLSRSAGAGRLAVQRARILLMADQGLSGAAISAALDVSRPAVFRTVKRCIALGARKALDDAPRSGRPARIGMEAKAWVASLARRLPQECADGPKAPRWTAAGLAEYVRSHCVEAGFPELGSVSSSTMWAILQEWGPGVRKTEGSPEPPPAGVRT